MDASIVVLMLLSLAAILVAAWAVVRLRQSPQTAAHPVPTPAATPADPPGKVKLTARDILNSRVINSAGDVHYHEATAPVVHSRITLPSRRRFVGRADLLADIERRLRSDDTIGVTSLKGIAGVGKSALALEAAYRFEKLFPDGRYWLDLRGVDATQALRTFLIQLGVVNAEQLQRGFDALRGLAADVLAEKRVLLVLDNAESIARSEMPHLRAMCVAPPGKTIITSRAMIGANDLRVDVLNDADALALLSCNGIMIKGREAAARALAARLGNLALALDITARRMVITTPSQTCAATLVELDCQATLIDALQLPRANTVDDSVALSFALTYDQLDADLRNTFHALGVCALGGAPATAMAYLCEATDAQTADALRALAMISLADFDGRRAELHPLLHEYARRWLSQDASSCADLEVRHVEFFGDRVGGSYQRAMNDDKDRLPPLRLIDDEIANVRLAQVRALAAGFPEPELAARLTDNLAAFWVLRGLDWEAQKRWLQRAAELALQLGERARAANCIKSLGDVHVRLAEFDQARQRYAEALPIYQEVHDRLGEANCIQRLGDVHVRLAEFDQARQRYAEALPIYQEVHARLGEANCIQRLGDVHVSLAEFDQARQRYAEALPIYQEVHARLGEANCIQRLGDVHVSLAEFDQARQRYAEALPIYQEVHARLGEANCIKRLGDVHVRLVEFDQARQRYAEALPIYQEVHDRLGEANCYTGLGRAGGSADNFNRAIELHTAVRSWDNLAVDLFCYGLWCSDNGDTRSAVTSLSQARDLWRRLGQQSYAEIAQQQIAALGTTGQ